jgi:DNA-binding CsgD family transcriptional regulator
MLILMAKATGASIKRVLTQADAAGGQIEQLDEARRRLLADWCRMVGHRLHGPAPAATGDATADAAARTVIGAPALAEAASSLDQLPLSPRMRDILERLLVGDSEKQIARHLGISPHTVHTHVKKLHKSLGVSSRGELLARFVNVR